MFGKIVLIEDKNQHGEYGTAKDKHKQKHEFWAKNGIKLLSYRLPVGDYIICDDTVMDVINRKNKRNMEPKMMDFLGTYRVVVDTKRNMEEISGEITNGKKHEQFRDSLILAQNNGIKLYVLVENTEGIKEVRDVFKWQNPRMHRYNKIKYMHNLGKWANVPLPAKPPVTGEQLAKAMLTMQLKYGVEFVFCTPQEAGAKVLELLKK